MLLEDFMVEHGLPTGKFKFDKNNMSKIMDAMRSGAVEHLKQRFEDANTVALYGGTLKVTPGDLLAVERILNAKRAAESPLDEPPAKRPANAKRVAKPKRKRRTKGSGLRRTEALHVKEYPYTAMCGISSNADIANLAPRNSGCFLTDA